MILSVIILELSDVHVTGWSCDRIGKIWVRWVHDKIVTENPKKMEIK